MPRNLKFVKGYNSGVIQGVLNEIDEDGNSSAFDLTGASSVSIQVYEEDGTVLATIVGSVVDATNGIYTCLTDGNDLDSVDDGDYLWRTKVVSATYPQGRLFDEDANGNPLYCTVI